MGHNFATVYHSALSGCCRATRNEDDTPFKLHKNKGISSCRRVTSANKSSG